MPQKISIWKFKTEITAQKYSETLSINSHQNTLKLYIYHQKCF